LCNRFLNRLYLKGSELINTPKVYSKVKNIAVVFTSSIYKYLLDRLYLGVKTVPDYSPHKQSDLTAGIPQTVDWIE
jgi:hypothetical protein